MNDWQKNPYNVRHYIKSEHRETRVLLERIRRYHYRVSIDMEKIEQRLAVIEANLDWAKRMITGAGVAVIVILVLLLK